MKQETIESFATYTSGGSGWIFQRIDNLFLRVDRFNPLKVEGYISLPIAIKSKKAVINVQNKNNIGQQFFAPLKRTGVSG